MFSTATSRCCPGPAQSCPRPRPRLRYRPTRPRCGRLASPAAPPAWLRLTSGSAALRQSWPPWFLRRDSRVLANGWSWRLTAVLTAGAQSLTVSEPNYCANSWSWAAKRYANSWSLPSGMVTCWWGPPAAIESGQNRCSGRLGGVFFLALGVSAALASSMGCRIRLRAFINLEQKKKKKEFRRELKGL